MDSTPVKTVSEKYCALCKDDKKRLHCLTGQKSSKENYKECIEQFLEKTLDPNSLEFMYVCEKCCNTCKMYSKFKADCVENLNTFYDSSHVRIKRMAKTPPSALKSSSAVVESVCSSVEKISLENSSHKEREKNKSKSIKSLNFKEPIDHAYSFTPPSGQTCTASSATDSETTISFKEPIDHAYSFTPLSDQTCTASSATDSETTISSFLQDQKVSKMTEQICHALAKISKTSILIQKRPDILLETHWFLSAFEEMKQNCPQLLEVLLFSLGNVALLNAYVNFTLSSLFMHRYGIFPYTIPFLD